VRNSFYAELMIFTMSSRHREAIVRPSTVIRLTNKVTAPGFKEAVQEGITVSIGTMSTLDIALQVGQTSQSVTVTANAQQIQTESSDVGTTVPGALVAQLPLNFSGVIRSPLQFTVIPGEAEESAVPRTFRGNGILSSNRIVISTEAQRSGEICGLAP
jgi:hypothetical protein